MRKLIIFGILLSCPIAASAGALDEIKKAANEAKKALGQVESILTDGRNIKRDTERIIQEISYNDSYVVSEVEAIRLQARLNQLGFSVGTPDGKIGEQTRRAISDFQRSVGIPADGSVTLGFLNALHDSALTTSISRTPVLSNSQWKRLQTELNLAGFPVGEADGIAGPNTQRAITAYAAAHGLQATPYGLLEHFNNSSSVSATAVPTRPVSSVSTTERIKVQSATKYTGNVSSDSTASGIAGDQVSMKSDSGRPPNLSILESCPEQNMPKATDHQKLIEYLNCLNIRQALDRFENSFLKLVSKTDLTRLGSLKRNQVEWYQDVDSTCKTDMVCFNGLLASRQSLIAKYFQLSQIQPERYLAILDGMEKKHSSHASTPEETLTNFWYGNVKCEGRNKIEVSREIILVMDREPDNLYRLNMKVKNGPSLETGTSVLSYIGEPMGGQGRTRFVVDRQRPVFNNQFGEFEFDQNTGIGRFSNGKCSSLTVVRLRTNDPLLRPVVSPEESPGFYWTANSDRERCEVLITWTSKINEEYGERDFYRSTQKGDGWRMVKIFSDRDFIPVFGDSFERLGHDKRKVINTFATRHCMKDPFTQNRMETYRSAAQRVLPTDPAGSNTSVYDTTFFAVLKMRALAHKVWELENYSFSSAETGNFNSVAERFEGIIATAKTEIDYFWPSDKTAIVSQLKIQLQGLATLEAKSHIENALLTTTAEARLMKTRFESKSAQIDYPFYAYLNDQSDRHEFIEQMETLHAQFASEVTSELVKKAVGTEASLENLKLYDGAFKQQLNSINNLSTKVRNDYEKLLEKEKHSRLQFLIDNDKLVSTVLKPTREDLIKGADWITQFTKRFEKYNDLEPYRTAFKSIKSAREKLLESALDEFQTAVLAAVSEDDVTQLLSEYLSWDADRDFPVALEYELLTL